MHKWQLPSAEGVATVWRFGDSARGLCVKFQGWVSWGGGGGRSKVAWLGGSVGRVCGANEGVSESRFKYSIN